MKISIDVNISKKDTKDSIVWTVLSNLGAKHFELGGRHALEGWAKCNCELAEFIRALDKIS